MDSAQNAAARHALNVAEEPDLDPFGAEAPYWRRHYGIARPWRPTASPPSVDPFTLVLRVADGAGQARERQRPSPSLPVSTGDGLTIGSTVRWKSNVALSDIAPTCVGN